MISTAAWIRLEKTDWAYHPNMEASNAHDFELKDGVETWKSK